MADMTPQEIMDAATKLYAEADSTYSVAAVRKAAKEACSLIFHLAKLHMPPPERKALKLGLPKVRKPKE